MYNDCIKLENIWNDERLAKLAPVNKLVYFHLCLHPCTLDTGLHTQTVKDIASQCHLSKATTQKTLDSLADAGLIVTDRNCILVTDFLDFFDQEDLLSSEPTVRRTRVLWQYMICPSERIQEALEDRYPELFATFPPANIGTACVLAQKGVAAFMPEELCIDTDFDMLFNGEDDIMYTLDEDEEDQAYTADLLADNDLEEDEDDELDDEILDEDEFEDIDFAEDNFGEKNTIPEKDKSRSDTFAHKEVNTTSRIDTDNAKSDKQANSEAATKTEITETTQSSSTAEPSSCSEPAKNADNKTE